MPVRSAWLINRTDTESGQSRADTRLAPLGTMTPTGALTSAPGVIPGSDDGTVRTDGLYVFGDTAGMTAKVAPGRALVQGGASAGAYPVVATDYATVTFADGNASNPRIDLVVLRIYDAQFDGGDRTEAVLEVVQGTPAGAPEAPAAPDASLTLAQVLVPAGASTGTGGIDWSTAVSDSRRITVAVGGILPEAGSWDVAGGYPGQYRDTTVQLQRWDGSHWASYPRQIGGVAPQGELAAGEYTGQYRDESGRLERWDGTVWRPAVAVPSTAFAYQNDGGYCTSTSWVESVTDTTGPTVTATFTVPVSGAVLVSLGFQGHSGVSGQWARMSARIRQNGTLVLEADETHSAVTTVTDDTSVAHTFKVSGLEPGTEYTAVSAYCTQATSSKAWYDNRWIRVDPWL